MRNKQIFLFKEFKMKLF